MNIDIAKVGLRNDVYGLKKFLTDTEKQIWQETIDTVLSELEKKDKIINDSIKEIEIFRQYFSEDLQPDFIRILEILKDKKVIEW